MKSIETKVGTVTEGQRVWVKGFVSSQWETIDRIEDDGHIWLVCGQWITADHIIGSARGQHDFIDSAKDVDFQEFWLSIPSYERNAHPEALHFAKLAWNAAIDKCMQTLKS